jgi:hypothetical protein
VLFDSCRRTHCALCFQAIQEEANKIDMTQHPRYPVFLCSRACLEAAESAGLPEEVQSAAAVLRKAASSHVKILPTAVLVYRLCGAIAGGTLRWNDLESMQSHATDTDQGDGAWHHRQAVLWLVQQLETTAGGSCSSAPNRAEALLDRISVNAFTITVGSKAVGLGLFETAHRINHSCCPNAVQTFHLASGRPAGLLVTTGRPVAPNEELCISYLDDELDAPVNVRQERLQQQYHFACNCPRCQSEESDGHELAGL